MSKKHASPPVSDGVSAEFPLRLLQVEKYLLDENRYTKSFMADTLAFQVRLFRSTFSEKHAFCAFEVFFSLGIPSHSSLLCM